MTGFARAERSAEGVRVRVEVKSVNGRGLDMRLRLAAGLDAFEVPLRQSLSRRLGRGSINLSVVLDHATATSGLRVDQQALDTVLRALDDLSGKVVAQTARIDAILALPGVLVSDESIALDEAVLGPLVLDCAEEAIERLQMERQREGRDIETVLRGHLDTITTLVDIAERHPARSREHVMVRLRQQIAMLADDAAIPVDRLVQEALILATKADIQEELDRLRAHLAAAAALLDAGGPVGRRLDFLAQEFNREANTLCSKANAVELTAIGLDLKAAIDQLREQVQNIE